MRRLETLFPASAWDGAIGRRDGGASCRAKLEAAAEEARLAKEEARLAAEARVAELARLAKGERALEKPLVKTAEQLTAEAELAELRRLTPDGARGGGREGGAAHRGGGCCGGGGGGGARGGEGRGNILYGGTHRTRPSLLTYYLLTAIAEVPISPPHRRAADSGLVGAL